MSKIHIISIFMGIAILVLTGVCTYQYARLSFEMPETNENTEIAEALPEEIPSPGEAVFTGTPSEPVIKRDTEYIMEKYNTSDYTLTEQKIKVPVEMLGLNREELIQYVARYEAKPTTEDLNNGFLSAEVISFSEEKIIIRKNYREPPEEKITEENCYILVAQRGVVTVYLNDYNHLYAVTEIVVSDLPEELQEEILDGKIIKGDKALYDFLEAYTS